MNDTIQALRSAAAYSHTVNTIEVVETHMSWIFLTGEHAYKLRKPLKLPFVDFSTLARRAHFSREEVRLNRRFTPDLYIGVRPVVRQTNGCIVVSEMPLTHGDRLIDWVVKMVQFDQSAQADHMVAAKSLSLANFYEFGARLAKRNASLPVAIDPPSIDVAIGENFSTLQAISGISTQLAQVERLQSHTNEQLDTFHMLLSKRATNGYVRDCHGDLHLANLVYRDNILQAFDCLEFNRGLREIDVWNDAAFLVMDCCIRHREDLAYSFVDGYLNYSGDYEGTILLSLYAQYRSIVRAKVAAIAYHQSGCTDESAYQRVQSHLNWAEQKSNSRPGLLVVCCGLSGSGKSHWAAQLAPQFQAIRIRSDVYRKTLAGLEAGDGSGSDLGSGLYDSEHSHDTYVKMTQLCTQLLPQGENVIIDATCLKKSQRQSLLQAAQRAGSRAIVLHLTAPTKVLQQRIIQRQQSLDASEADLGVLAWQQQFQEPPGSSEPVIRAGPEIDNVDDLARTIREFASKII